MNLGDHNGVKVVMKLHMNIYQSMISRQGRHSGSHIRGVLPLPLLLSILQDTDKAYPYGPAWHLLVASKGELSVG